jgi:DNA polymerase III delta subunit
MPAVTPEAARQQITSGRLAPVYLLVGDDERQITSLVEAFAATLDEGLRAFNYERLYAGDKDLTPADVVNAARIGPMMAPFRVVVLLRAEKWLKPKRAAAVESAEDAEGGEPPGRGEAEPKSALTPLVEYLKAPVPSTALVVVAADVNRSLAAVKALLKQTVVECWGLMDRDARGAPMAGGSRQALAVVREAAAAVGRQVEPAAAQLLAERSGGDIGKLRADLDHALLFAQGRPMVTRADVDAVATAHAGPQDPWAMTNAIERGQVADALRQLGMALDEGAVPYMLLGQLGWFVRDKLSKIRPQQVPAAVRAVFRTDLDLKSSGGDPRILLERLVIELCGGPRR